MKVTYPCSTCGREVLRQPSGVVGRVFCSRGCNHAANKGAPSVWKGVRGAAHGAWRGGRTENNGYIRVLLPGHPMADKRGYVLEHRLVVSEILGRPLKPQEHVHHRNLNRSDNRPENLVALLLPEHAAVHRAGEKILFPWSRRGSACLDCGDSDRRHFGHGLCARCYQRARMRRQRAAGYIAPSRRKPPPSHY